MGAWGTGLYSSDFAQDLRSTVRAVARLPFESDRLLDILRECEPEAAANPEDSDHSNFWLTVADQFARLGIDCPPARDQALEMIDRGTDLAIMASLGMEGRDLTNRGRMLADLRASLSAPKPCKPRKTLKKPQPLLFAAGTAVAYPVALDVILDDGKVQKFSGINPYFTAADRARYFSDWKPQGWGVFVVVECGLSCDLLAWYRPLVSHHFFQVCPTMADLSGPQMWHLDQPGTLSRIHAQRSELLALGGFPIDPARLDRYFPQREPALSYALRDISIANAFEFTLPPLHVEGVIDDVSILCKAAS